MKISDLGYLPETHLPEGSSLFRIQWARPRASSVSRGPLKLPVAGTGHGRFDLTAHPVAYLAESPETAADETLARRETVSMSISTLLKRRLLTLHTTRSTRLGGARSRPLSPA
ncbi:RES domain-containing protein [Rubrivivax gelatinosus]|uniref:RES domain-containing protein n=1 Tax=Rubrivivax gelatinosus TaxID=28068 RepID=UPI00190576F3